MFRHVRDLSYLSLFHLFYCCIVACNLKRSFLGFLRAIKKFYSLFYFSISITALSTGLLFYIFLLFLRRRRCRFRRRWIQGRRRRRRVFMRNEKREKTCRTILFMCGIFCLHSFFACVCVCALFALFSLLFNQVLQFFFLNCIKSFSASRISINAPANTAMYGLEMK